MKKEDFVSMMDDLEKPTLKLAELVPEHALDTTPIPNTMTFRVLLSHLASSLEDVEGFFLSEKWEPPIPDHEKSQGKSKDQLIQEIRDGHVAVRECYGKMSQEFFETTFREFPWGAKGTIEQLSVSLLYNHQIHHKMQLFLYLKALGIELDTGTLYLGMEPGEMKM